MEEWKGGEAFPDYFEDYDTIGGGGGVESFQIILKTTYYGMRVCWGGGGRSPFRLGGGGEALSDFEDYYSPFTPSIYIYIFFFFFFFFSQILCFQEMLKQQNTDKLNRNGKLSPDYFIPNNFRKGWGK